MQGFLENFRGVADATLIALSIIFALVASTRRNPVYGILFLMGVGFCVAGIFALSGAFFLALLQILIYIGTVLVLFIFVVSLLNLQPEELRFAGRKIWRALAFLAVGVFLVAVAVLTLSALPQTERYFMFFPAKEIALALLKDYVFHFELLSIFLLTVIVATGYVGRRFK